MRMNYKTYPTDYIQQLNKDRGVRGRKKSRAFMEYWNDMEHGGHNSESFYGKSWEVSNSTSHTWIKEFMMEIELFLSHWDIRNKQHYNYAKNQTEEQVSKTRSYKAQNIGVYEEVAEEQPREAPNIYNNNNTKSWTFDKEFIDLFFIYGANTKYKGKKEEAFEQFQHVDIDINLLKLAAVTYLRDQSITKKYNLTNFLKNEIYLSYIPKKIKLTLDGVDRVGIYDDSTMLFTSETDSFVGQISAARLVELYGAGSLEFLKL